MQEIMDEESIRYRELYSPIFNQGFEKYSQYYIPDDGHFTATGAVVLAKELEKMID